MAACASATGTQGTEPSDKPQPTEVPQAEVRGRYTIQTDDPVLGPADAPITLVEYGDFGCSDCKDWYDEGTLKQIKAKYGDKLRIVWRDYAIITLQSPKAAEAARCAHDEGKFWKYHDVLFDHFPALEIADLKAYAAQLGLDSDRFNECLDSGWHADQVDRGLRDATDLGFLGVPSFLVNDKKLVGVLDADYLESVIDPLLPSR
jgi:protein-disulfide isomerase